MNYGALGGDAAAAAPAAPPTPPTELASVDGDLQDVVITDAGGDDGHQDVGRYYVSFTAKKGHGTLHLTGGCWRVPGRDIKRYTFHNDLEGVVYSAYCRNCWGVGRAPETAVGGGVRSPGHESSSATTSSSSTESEGEGFQAAGSEGR